MALQKYDWSPSISLAKGPHSGSIFSSCNFSSSLCQVLCVCVCVCVCVMITPSWLLLKIIPNHCADIRVLMKRLQSDWGQQCRTFFKPISSPTESIIVISYVPLQEVRDDFLTSLSDCILWHEMNKRVNIPNRIMKLKNEYRISKFYFNMRMFSSSDFF